MYSKREGFMSLLFTFIKKYDIINCKKIKGSDYNG